MAGQGRWSIPGTSGVQTHAAAGAVTAQSTRLLMSGGAVISLAAAYLFLIDRSSLAPAGIAPLLAVLVAASLSSLAGFAFSAISGALLFHLLHAPVTVVEIILLCSVANQMLSVLALWRDIVWRLLLPFALAGALGTPVGVLLMLHSDPHAYLHVFGFGLVAYSLHQLLRRPSSVPRRAAQTGPADCLAGFLGGVGSGFAGFAGAPVAIWLNAKGWDKVRQRAVFQPFILFVQILSLALMFVLRDDTIETVSIDTTPFIYLPLSLLGTWCGLQVFRRMTDRQFTVVINLLLIVSGLGMIV